MSTNPNTVKSQDDLPTCNSGKRSSEVVLSAVEKCERLQKQLDIAVEGLNEYAKPHNVNMYDGDYTISMGCRYLSDNGKVARKYLQRIKELNK